MSTGTVSGSISAEEMIDPAALRQEQLLGRLDALAKQVADMGVDLNNHLDEFCDRPEAGEAHLTLSDKLDRLQQDFNAQAVKWAATDGAVMGISSQLESLAESQGKLLAAIDDMKSEFDHDFTKLYNGHGLCLKKLGELLDAWNLAVAAAKPPRKRRRK